MTPKQTVSQTIPKIKLAPESLGVQGEYYVTWGVDNYARYLHPDGSWCDTTLNDGGRPTGYFPSKEAAETATAKYVK